MEKQIKLDEKSAQEFVSAASRCNFDIDVFYNRIIIDAKSILGLLSLDLTKTLTVSVTEKMRILIVFFPSMQQVEKYE